MPTKIDAAHREQYKVEFQEYGEEAVKRTTTCRWCNTKLTPVTYGYEHDGGWSVPDLIGRFWLFLVCAKCGYEWALSKLGLPRDWSAKE